MMTIWDRRCQSGRLFLLASCAVLLLTASSLYAYYRHYASVAAVGSVSPDFLGPLLDATEHTNISDTGDQNTSHSTAPGVEDDLNDLYVLHPEQHVYRDPITIRMTWNVTMDQRAPDGVMRPVYLINGQFPGPTIEARSGDELVIDVYNSVENSEEEGISIHWHGLSMKGANEMDGVVGLSQCAIGSSESYTYRFHIDDMQFGTFWYHAHSGVQRADGLFGGLVVHKPADNASLDSDISVYKQQPERLLLVGDWYHRPANAVFDWFQDPNHFGYEPAPDSLLINGKGYFNCSMALKGWPLDCSPVERPVVAFTESSGIKLRVINTGASAGFSISLSQARMTVIAVDGGNPVAPNTPSATSIGLLYPGERIDVLVERVPTGSPGSATAPGASNPDMEQGSEIGSKLTIALDLENFKLPNFALSPRQAFPVVWSGESSEDVRKDDDHEPAAYFNLAEASGSPVMEIAEKPVETAVLYTKMSIRSDTGLRPIGSVNHTTWRVADPKARPLLALDRSQWDGVINQPSPMWSLNVPWYHESGENRWMELVLNNIDDKGHAFHLHGYDFYVVSTKQSERGYPGTYNPFDPAAAPPPGSINTLNPLRKDTVYVPRNGYVVLRFPLANDGLWLLHCHVIWHSASGMGIVIQVGDIAEDTKQRAATLCSR